eukprot:7963893-Prorocentrum_lima.AAC.1
MLGGWAPLAHTAVVIWELGPRGAVVRRGWKPSTQTSTQTPHPQPQVSSPSAGRQEEAFAC